MVVIGQTLSPEHDLNRPSFFKANDYDGPVEAQHGALRQTKRRGGLDERTAERRNEDSTEEMLERIAGGLERAYGEAQGVPEGKLSLQWAPRRSGRFPGSDSPWDDAELLKNLHQNRLGYLRINARNRDVINVVRTPDEQPTAINIKVAEFAYNL